MSASAMANPDIRVAMLSVIDRLAKGGGRGSMQSGSVLNETAQILGVSHPMHQQAILTLFGELFRTGYLAWGLDFSNPNPPFFHLTEQGRKTLAQLSSDPGNPAGYLLRIDSVGTINPIAKSYLEEALNCFIADLNKAAAVMVGGASESLVIELRDAVVAKQGQLGKVVPKDLKDWRPLKILSGLKNVFDQYAASLPKTLKEEYESYWPAFTQQIRSARNDAGHPCKHRPYYP